MKKKARLVRQLSTSGCGIACLTMLFNYHGSNISINEITTIIGRDGMSLAKMKEIAGNHNFNMQVFEGNLQLDALSNNAPLIVSDLKNHFVVISKIKKNKIYILDPLNGEIIIEFEEFKKKYLNLIILITPTNATDYKKASKKQHYSLKVNKKKMGFIISLAIISQAIMLVPALLVQEIINKVTLENASFSIEFFLMYILVFSFIYFSITWCRKRMILLFQTEVYVDTVFDMLNKIFKIDLSFFSNHSSGDIASRFKNTHDLHIFISGTVITVVLDSVLAIFCSIIMFLQSRELFLTILSIAIIQVLCVISINKKIKHQFTDYAAEQNSIDGSLIETLVNIQQIRCMNINHLYIENLQNSYIKVADKIKKKNKSCDLLECILKTISTITPLILYSMGALLILDGKLYIGELIAFSTLSMYFISPFTMLSFLLPNVQNLKEVYTRLCELMCYKDTKQTGSIDIEEVNDIKFDNVSFSYNHDQSNINNIFLNIDQGEKIAIIGASGSGKTTLTKLLTKNYDSYEGDIFVNGIDLKDISIQSIGKLISFVTQVPIVSNKSIRDNIDIFNNLTDDEIYYYLSMVNLDADVRAFPLGLNTFIGEGGNNISGGQKQRITLARALASNPKMIILDEATSNLDTISEKIIMNNLKKKNITQLIITHRLSSITDADKIYIVEKGSLVEQGTHQELLKQKGIYHNLNM